MAKSYIFDGHNLAGDRQGVASRDDPVSWRFGPGYWVGRLGRLTILVRLTSELEARSLAESVPHSRRNPDRRR